MAAELARRLGDRTAIVSTDGFLHPNAVLAERGLEMRKGFPETFDLDALAALLEAARAGRFPLTVPVYSHLVYDVTGEWETVPAAEVVIVEGVVALQPALVRRLDVGVYVHAAEADLERWFTDRLLRLVAEARNEPRSFYAGFSSLDADALRAFAAGVWRAINVVNLREHILPTRDQADLVVHKRPDHAVERVAARAGR